MFFHLRGTGPHIDVAFVELWVGPCDEGLATPRNSELPSATPWRGLWVRGPMGAQEMTTANWNQWTEINASTFAGNLHRHINDAAINNSWKFHSRSCQWEMLGQRGDSWGGAGAEVKDWDRKGGPGRAVDRQEGHQASEGVQSLEVELRWW